MAVTLLEVELRNHLVNRLGMKDISQTESDIVKEPGFFKWDTTPVNNGCVLCGNYRGYKYRYLRTHLRIHGGIRRICYDCKSTIAHEKERIVDAFHEAGHVVMRLAQRRRFRYVTISREPHESNGALYYDDPHVRLLSAERQNPSKVSNRNFHAVRSRILCKFSGEAAESILYGRSFGHSRRLNRLPITPGDDGYEFAMLSNSHPDLECLRSRFYSTSMVILKSRWKQVTKIAHALLDTETMTCAQVQELLSDGRAVRSKQQVQGLFHL